MHNPPRQGPPKGEWLQFTLPQWTRWDRNTSTLVSPVLWSVRTTEV